jgi:hypothetical protein
MGDRLQVGRVCTVAHMAKVVHFLIWHEWTDVPLIHGAVDVHHH